MVIKQFGESNLLWYIIMHHAPFIHLCLWFAYPQSFFPGMSFCVFFIMLMSFLTVSPVGHTCRGWLAISLTWWSLHHLSSAIWFLVAASAFPISFRKHFSINVRSVDVWFWKSIPLLVFFCVLVNISCSNKRYIYMLEI